MTRIQRIVVGFWWFVLTVFTFAIIGGIVLLPIAWLFGIWLSHPMH